MKRETVLTQTLAAVLAFLLSGCGVGCVVTAFDLPLNSGVLLGVSCAAAGLLGCVCFQFRRGWLIPTVLAAATGVMLWRGGELARQSLSLAYYISVRGHSAYGTPVLGNPGAPVDIPLMILGALVALATAWTVCRRKTVVVVLLSLVLPVGCCVLVTDTVPEGWCLFGLMFGFGLLWLTDWARRQREAWANRLTLYGAVPLLLALAMLFLSMPQESYVNRAEEYTEQMLVWTEKLMGAAQETAEKISWNENGSTNQVDLSAVGPKIQWSTPVADVTAPVSGTVYLRQQDYVTYSGTGWLSPRNRSEIFQAEGGVLGTITIQTRGSREERLVPYYPQEEVTLAGGCVRDESSTTYSYTMVSPRDREQVQPGLTDAETLDLLLGSASATTFTQYKQLPTDTLRWAKELADQITEDCYSVEDQVSAIGNYVRSSARYDLDTRRMTGSKDFAQWFLEQSDTGYCVHFATAATVLLRAVGIPARYVEGYMFTCRMGQEVTVTEKSAHAWVEYYEGGIWRILEATPPDLSEQAQQAMAAPVAPEETRPDATEATAPAETGPTSSQPEKPAREQPPEEKGKLPGWAWAVLWLMLAAGGVAAQSTLRLYMREQAWNQGSPNQKALKRWGQVKQLARLTGCALPEELEHLAQKAKFSQHTLTQEELLQFDVFRNQARKILADGPVLRRWAIRLLLGAA